MQPNPHRFCRQLLKDVLRQVRLHAAPGERKAAWSWKGGLRDTVEFHGPQGFYWHGQGCCRWHASAQGWQAWLEQHPEAQLCEWFRQQFRDRAGEPLLPEYRVPVSEIIASMRRHGYEGGPITLREQWSDIFNRCLRRWYNNRLRSEAFAQHDKIFGGLLATRSKADIERLRRLQL